MSDTPAPLAVQQYHARASEREQQAREWRKMQTEPPSMTFEQFQFKELVPARLSNPADVRVTRDVAFADDIGPCTK